MQLADELISRLDWDAAIETTAPARGEFFPSRIEANAALSIREPLARWLDTRLRSGRRLGPPEVVYVPRKTIGTRPAFDVAFADRAVLTALAQALIERLEPLAAALGLDLGLDAPAVGVHRAYERQPLADATAKAIVVGDVSAFYEYVDHRLLGEEIVELTGDIDLSRSIGDALAELVGRDFGLPQGPRASDVFADFYLTDIDRRLARAGVTSYRRNDEFRLPVTRVEEGDRVLVHLEGELRRLGLVLNPAKTRIPSRNEYETSLAELEQRLEQAREAAYAEESGYGFDPDEFADVTWEELPVDQVESTFSTALGEDSADDPGNVAGRVLEQCLPPLARATSTVPLPHLRDLVRRHGLVRYVSVYLRRLAGTDAEGAMVEAVSTLLRSSVYLLPWVRGWLIDPLARCTDPLPPELRRHLSRTMVTQRLPWFVRTRAALVLATESALPDQQVVARLFDEASASGRADIVAAVKIGAPDWANTFLTSLSADEPILQAIPLLLEGADFRELI